MNRSRAVRVLALITGFAASLGTSGLSVTHGYSHHEERERAPHAEARNELPAAMGASRLADAGAPEDHGHPVVGGAVCSRDSTGAIALPVVVAALPPVAVSPREAVRDPGVDQPSNPADSRPARSRAPPANR